MAQAFTDLRVSPLTGAPMGAAVVTGDSADMHSHLELRWYIDLLDGSSVRANSGAPDRFEGVQAWPEATWAYRPGRPVRRRLRRATASRRLPELLDAGDRASPSSPSACPAPWYAVYGNHDTLLLGTFDLDRSLRALAVGDQKAFTLEATASGALSGYAASASPLQRIARRPRACSLGMRSGYRPVTSDPARFLFEQRDFMAEHFRTEPTPGPVGHGFTQHNLDTGETWWKADLSPRVRAFGLDTCNQVAGPDGAVPDDQFQWLEAELTTAQAEQRLVLIFSHHNSLTLENRATRPGFDQPLHGAEEFVDLLLRYPVVRRLAQRAHPPEPDPRPPKRAGHGRFLGGHHRVVHRLPAAAAGRRAGRQPRRHDVDLHHGASTTRHRPVPAPAAAWPTWPRRAASWPPTTGPRRR